MVDGEDGGEAGEAALGGEGDGPVEVVVETGDQVDGEEGQCEGGGGSENDVELGADGLVVETICDCYGDDGGEGGGEEEEADVLFEEEGWNEGRSGEDAAERVCCGGALEEIDGDKDGEGAVAVVDGVRVDAVDAEGREGSCEEGGDEA